MITAINLTKSFGSNTLFENINFNINKGERIGLVGRNGHGKTTLIKIIVKEEHQDSGEIVIPRDYSIGYVKQNIKFTKDTVLEEGCLGLPEHHKDEQWMVEKILSGLGFTKEEMEKDPSQFSGGYQVRLNLAKVLVSEPNMLLLDEPTNYLDVVAIRWLASFLRQWKGELILITHDRSFIDSVITHTIGLHRNRAKKIEGNTEKYYEQILKEEEIHEKTRINDEKKRKETELFITRFRAKARLAGMVQSRIKALEKQDKLEKLDKIKNMDFSFNYIDFNAKVMMKAEHLTFGYDNTTKLLINDFSLSIGKHDRICVIGKNGKGKTTLLKLLSGEITPHKGDIQEHLNTKKGHFVQTNIAQLNDNATIEEEMINSGCERQLARNICGVMMFEGDNALKKIKVLSGGEKARVLLGKILATPSNLLFLDEPTNHLDMESCDALLAAIDDFDGAIVMVTHNEMFLHTLATRFVVFQENGILLYEGSYQSFLDKIGWEEEFIPSSNKEKNEKSNISKKDQRKKRAEQLALQAKEIKPLEKNIARLEEEIEKDEKELDFLNNEMILASGSGNSNKITELSKKIHEVQKKIDEMYTEYEELTDELETKKKEFEDS